MGTATTWAPPAAGSKYNLPSGGPVTRTTSELNAAVTPSEGAAAEAAPWSPSSPLFWFGALAAVTFGLMAVSTSVRVGPAKVSASLGKG